MFSGRGEISADGLQRVKKSMGKNLLAGAV
jgi:hypothetical protein